MALKMGWRWKDGSLCFTESWKEEDMKAGTTPTRRTANCLLDSMNEMYGFLRFTREIGEDFPDGKLPSLDTAIWVRNGQVLFEFYEKPMATILMVEANSALSEEVKMASLAEEVMRRLRNTSIRVPNGRIGYQNCRRWWRRIQYGLNHSLSVELLLLPPHQSYN